MQRKQRCGLGGAAAGAAEGFAGAGVFQVGEVCCLNRADTSCGVDREADALCRADRVGSDRATQRHIMVIDTLLFYG